MQTAKYSFAWAAAADAALTAPVSHSGFIKQHYVTVAENTTNNITFTLEILDDDSVSIYSLGAIADNGTTSTQLTTTTMIPIGHNFKVKVTPSGVPGATGATVTVKLFMTEASSML